jgi:hypothetical protein
MLLLDPAAKRPAGKGQPLSETALEERDPEAVLLCFNCRRVVTHADQRIEVDGHHRHSRMNPHGLSFVFGCFGEAPGVKTFGDAYAEHSWFTGFRWRIVLCAACQQHLGWRFEGSGIFYGLLLARLIPAGRAT